jgi:hypothetical protein
MSRILMLDVGNTLIREADGTLFPHVLPALETIRAFTTPSGEVLGRCLVSNYPRDLPVPAEQLPQVFQSFLNLLPPQLAALFEPADRLITLSAYAGAAKPDRRVFEKAVERLGARAGLSECLFITEEADHIAACRRLGMQTLQFGGHQSPPPPGSDFTDWLEAPLLIARLLDPSGHTNLASALRARLAVVAPQLEKVKVEPGPGPRRLRAHAQAWAPVNDPSLGELDGVHVAVPVHLEARLDERGHLLGIEGGTPDAGDLAEAAQMMRSLAATGQVATPANPAPRAATHQVETDPQGRRYLKRKRFTQW